MGTRIETTSYGVAAVRCLRGVVADYKQDDPMRPVTILLPNLGAVNVVIHGLLGEGVAASTRIDPQAKGLGEWLRARLVAVEDGLL